MILSGESQTQPWVEGKEVKVTQRIAAIVKFDESKFLMLKNLDPSIDMLAFPNWNLKGLENSSETVLRLLVKRTGFYDVKEIRRIDGQISWKFRKPLPDAKNEDASYMDSLYVIELGSLAQEITEDTSHEVVWVDADNIDDMLQKNGANGSSYLLRRLYLDDLFQSIKAH